MVVRKTTDVSSQWETWTPEMKKKSVSPDHKTTFWAHLGSTDDDRHSLTQQRDESTRPVSGPLSLLKEFSQTITQEQGILHLSNTGYSL